MKMSLLSLLERGPKRFSELVRELERPDKTVYVTLKKLVAMKLVSKNEAGEYVVTEAGRRELERIELVSALGQEDDPEIISSVANLYFLLSRKKDGRRPSLRDS